MPKKRMSAEQIVVLLRQIEVQTSQWKMIQAACREAGISDKCFIGTGKSMAGWIWTRRGV